jgi:hypothetical protein
MKPRLYCSALAALAVFLVASSAQGGPPAGEPGQHTLIFRSLEDPNVSNRPNECPFPGANLFLGASLWSEQTRASDGRVVNEAPSFGVVLAGCALRLTQGPAGFQGGIASSMSIFNPLRLPGAGTGSFWTLRVYTTEN